MMFSTFVACRASRTGWAEVDEDLDQTDFIAHLTAAELLAHAQVRQASAENAALCDECQELSR